MAIIKRYSSAKKSVKSIINYVMDKDKTQDGKLISSMNCSPENVLEEMAATKELYNKTDGVKYHHIIQSFSPGEITPEKAHELGKELAEKKFKGYECIISTHVDKDHIHNHIVYNSVNQETGRKYNASNKSLWDLKRESNLICEREGLKQIDLDKRVRENITSAELRIFLRGERSWKEELRDCINDAKGKSSSLEEMQKYLKDTYNVDMKIQNKNISFLHPDKEKYIRGSKLGEDYTKGEIENEFTRRKTREESSTELVRGDVIWDIRQYESNEVSTNQSRGLTQAISAMEQGENGTNRRVNEPTSRSLQENEQSVGECGEFTKGIYQEEGRGFERSNSRIREPEQDTDKRIFETARGQEADIEREVISNSNSSRGELDFRANVIPNIETGSQVNNLAEQLKSETIKMQQEKEQKEKERQEKERLLQEQKEQERERALTLKRSKTQDREQ